MECSGLRARGARDDSQGRNRRDFCLVDLVVLLEGFHFRHKLIEMRRSATPGVKPLTTKKQRARSFFPIVLRVLRFFVVGFHSFRGVAHYGRDERNRSHEWKNSQIMARRRSPIFARLVRHSPRVRTEGPDLSRPPAGPRLWVRPAK